MTPWWWDRKPSDEPPHRHRLTECHECDAGEKGPCIHCNDRGYYEICVLCGEPMGNARRKWRRRISEAVKR